MLLDLWSLFQEESEPEAVIVFADLRLVTPPSITMSIAPASSVLLEVLASGTITIEVQ